MTERKPNVSVSIVLPLFLDIKFGHGDIHEWSGPRLTSYNAYCWHSVQNQMKTCLFAVQSQSGYTHTNNVLCLCPSPQASKLCVWCGAQGKWSHHVSKTNRRGRNRALCIGKQSWMMNHGLVMQLGGLSLTRSLKWTTSRAFMGKYKWIFMFELHHWPYDLHQDCLTCYQWRL